MPSNLDHKNFQCRTLCVTWNSNFEHGTNWSSFEEWTSGEYEGAYFPRKRLIMNMILEFDIKYELLIWTIEHYIR